MQRPSTMKNPSQTKIDISAITGPYQVLGLLLLVIEGLMGYWLFRADSSMERGFTGLVMVLILFGLFYSVIRIKREETTALAVHPPGVTAIKPPQSEVTGTELAAPTQDAMPGPDRSYLINLPPSGWVVREMTLSDWLSAGIGVQDPVIKERLFPSDGQVADILVLQREKQTSIIPLPGKTIIDGRRFPTALETLVPTQLSIIPFARAQAPLFVERSLEHNFLTFLGQMLGAGILTAKFIESGVIRQTSRRYLSCELQQKLQNVIVDGKESSDVAVTISVIGIEGDLGDHLLVMKYPTLRGDQELDQNLQTIRELVASFRPLKVANASEKRTEIAALAGKNFKKLLAEKGQDIFGTELRFLLLLLKGSSMDDLETRVRAIKLFKPFEAFAQEIGLRDEELDSLWKDMRTAE